MKSTKTQTLKLLKFKDILPTPPRALEAELQEKIKAIVNAIYRKNIENFVDFKYLQEIFSGYD